MRDWAAGEEMDGMWWWQEWHDLKQEIKITMKTSHQSQKLHICLEGFGNKIGASLAWEWQPGCFILNVVFERTFLKLSFGVQTCGPVDVGLETNLSPWAKCEWTEEDTTIIPSPETSVIQEKKKKTFYINLNNHFQNNYQESEEQLNEQLRNSSAIHT